MKEWEVIIGYMPYIYKLARYYNLVHLDFAEELVLDLAENLNKYDESRGKIATFIYQRSRSVRRNLLYPANRVFLSNEIIEVADAGSVSLIENKAVCAQVLSECNDIEREAMLSMMADFDERQLFEVLNTNRKTRNKRIERFRTRYKIICADNRMEVHPNESI
jgi:hypothetical protein